MLSPAEIPPTSSGPAALPSSIITLLTDFGTADGYVAAMKGVILSLCPRVQIVDLSHEVAPQRVAAGAFLLEAHFRFFPAGTIHVAVVDPGVGTTREALACRHAGHYFVAPDNGLLDFCLESGPVEAVRLSRPGYWRGVVSATFHGRDIFAPVAAYLANGVPLTAMGEPVALVPRQTARRAVAVGGRLQGEVVYIDRFGNLISNIQQGQLRDFCGAQPVVVRVAGTVITGLVHTYGNVAPGAVVALIDSFDRLEIGVRSGNARAQLHADLGTPVIVERGV